jgi:hypothetical protein
LSRRILWKVYTRRIVLQIQILRLANAHKLLKKFLEDVIEETHGDPKHRGMQMRAETQGKKANVIICLEKSGAEQSGQGNETGHDKRSEGDLAHVDAGSGTRVGGRAAGTGSGGRCA